MLPNAGKWTDVLLDVSEDNDLTVEADLGHPFMDLLVLVPACPASTTVTVHVSETTGGTFYPLHILDDDATGSFASATTAGTAAIAVIFRIGGVQFVKIALSAGQAADKTFRVRGLGAV